MTQNIEIALGRPIDEDFFQTTDFPVFQGKHLFLHVVLCQNSFQVLDLVVLVVSVNKLIFHQFHYLFLSLLLFHTRFVKYL